MKPVRIQRKRAAGYNMQAVSRATNGLDCISVTRPRRWGNPYDIELFGRELSLKLFRESVEGVWNPTLLEGCPDEMCDAASTAHSSFMKHFAGEHPLTAARSELRGHNLACYCKPPDSCHADVLLTIANGDA